MKVQETLIKGKMWVQILDRLTIWKPSDKGRILYSLQDNNLFFGGDYDWIPCGILSKYIKDYHIDWDINLDNPSKVKAKSIPCTSDLGNTTVQDSLDVLYSYIDLLKNGHLFNPHVLNYDHLDTYSSAGVTSEKIMIQDKPCHFSNTPYSISIDSALRTLYTRRADGVELSKYNTFGTIIPISANNVQSALEELELYVSNLKARDIECNFWQFDANDSACQTTDVQDALNRIYSKIKSLKLKELDDVQNDYGLCKQVLKSCGEPPSGCCDFDTDIQARWEYVQASEVECKVIQPIANLTYGVPLDTNVQVGLDYLLQHAKIKDLLDVQHDYGIYKQVLKTNGESSLAGGIHAIWGNLRADEIGCDVNQYMANDVYGVPNDTNVQIALDYLFAHSKIVDLLDVQHDYGISGQILKTQGPGLDSAIWAFLSADEIGCEVTQIIANDTYGVPQNTNLQTALDYLFDEAKLKNLLDVQHDYGTSGQILKTYGPTPSGSNPNAYWGNIIASEIGCNIINSYANDIYNIPQNTDVQVAIDYFLLRDDELANDILEVRNGVIQLNTDLEGYIGDVNDSAGDGDLALHARIDALIYDINSMAGAIVDIPDNSFKLTPGPDPYKWISNVYVNPCSGSTAPSPPGYGAQEPPGYIYTTCEYDVGDTEEIGPQSFLFRFEHSGNCTFIFEYESMSALSSTMAYTLYKNSISISSGLVNEDTSVSINVTDIVPGDTLFFYPTGSVSIRLKYVQIRINKNI